jgi:hypothetical protein
MKRVETEQELQTLRAPGEDFVFNDFTSGPSPQYNVLHSAACRWLARMNLGVQKIYFAPDEDPVSWLNRTKGREGVAWKRCATCGGGSRGPGAGTSSEARRRESPLPVAVAESGGTAYLVLPPDAADPAVRAWSATRLQLRGGSWHVDFKGQLVRCVSHLRAGDGGILHATFAAAGGEGFDLENALLYNVGTGWFGPSGGEGLRFERAFEVPQPASGTFAHHHG